MISQIKIDANRRNAQKSTGPKTPSGKAIASRNAVQHGLFARKPVIPGEDVAEFQAYTVRWVAELKPLGPMEEFLAERIISIAWRLRRVGQIEAGLFGPSDSQEAGQLSRLNRYEASLERSFYRNVKELERLQAERGEAEPEETADSADYAEEQNEATGVEVPQNVLLNRPGVQGVESQSCEPQSSF